MKKKYLVLSLVLALCLSLAAPTLAVEYGAELNPNETTYTQRFSDVPTNHWAFQYVGELAEQGAINGYPDGKFYPDKIVTREEFAKIMVVAAGLTAAPADHSSYTDVDVTYWASPFIETAKPYMTAYQSASGMSFRPKSGALREDIAVAVVKLKGYDVRLADLDLIQTMFSDADSISAAAQPYVALAVEHGIISGYVDGTFRGQATITRSEAAAMLWRTFQRGSANKVIVTETTPAPKPSETPVTSPEPIASEKPSVSEQPTPTPSPAPTTPYPTDDAPDGYIFITSSSWKADPGLYEDDVYLVNIVDTNGSAATMRVTGSLKDAIAAESNRPNSTTDTIYKFWAIKQVDENKVVSALGDKDGNSVELKDVKALGNEVITLRGSSYSYDSATKFVFVDMARPDDTSNTMGVREPTQDKWVLAASGTFDPANWFNATEVDATGADSDTVEGQNPHGATYISVQASVIERVTDTSYADYVYVVRYLW